MITLAKTTILTVLGSAFAILLLQRLRRRAGVRVPLGISAVLFFSLSYLFFEQIKPFFHIVSLTSDAQIKNGIATLLCLSIAYTANVCIHRFVYLTRLTIEGDSKVPLIFQYLVTAMVYLIAVMVIISLVYQQSVFAIAATSGALAIVLGYSARTVLEEIFAGIAINFSSPFEKGDLVEINSEWAIIKDIGWRSITYLDMDSNDVVVPNSAVAASKIRNLDRPGGLTRRLLYFLVEYNIPPKIVIDQTEDAMKECPNILDHELNDVCLFSFDDTGIKYRAAFHIKHYDNWWTASDEFCNALWYRFKRHGIRFGQQRHLNFKIGENADRGLPSSALDAGNWQALLDRFNQTPMFESMNEEDMAELAQNARLHVVGPPERIMRAGSKRTSMYLIASGQADVYEVDDNGKETWMDNVEAGETVGLMALLTGESQRTTIRAHTETAVWEISSESLHALFKRKPEIMDNIAAAVAKWQAEENTALEAIQHNRQQAEANLEKRASSLYSRISQFFDRDKKEGKSDNYTGF